MLDNPYLGQSVDCSVCGKSERLSWYKAKCEELLNNKQCFSCNFWITLSRGNREECLVINNVHYMLGDENQRGLRGFNGQKFTIRMIDSGKELSTTNLWTQGTIPGHLRHMFQNNAEFVS